MQKPGRKQLVGLLPELAGEVLEEGAQIVADPHQAIPMTMLGHVTSSYMSPNLGRAFALALIKDGRARIGERLYVPMLDRTIRDRDRAGVLRQGRRAAACLRRCCRPTRSSTARLRRAASASASGRTWQDRPARRCP